MRIPAEDLEDPAPPTEIVWVDINSANRCWGIVDHAHSATGDGGPLQSDVTKATNEDDEDTYVLKWRVSDDEESCVPHSSKWPDVSG